MNDRLVSQETIDWLLESQIPSIRYLTRQATCCTGRRRQRPSRPTGRQSWRVVRFLEILTGQTPAGHWAGEKSYYTPKYVSSHWSMQLMAELAAEPGDPRVRRGAEFMLADTARRWGERLENGHYGLACFWGNLLRYVQPSMPADDERIGRIVAYLGNEALESEWRCAYNDELPCAWGAVRALWGLALCPPELAHRTLAGHPGRRPGAFCWMNSPWFRPITQRPGSTHSALVPTQFPPLLPGRHSLYAAGAGRTRRFAASQSAEEATNWLSESPPEERPLAGR